jgi:ABC-type cobalamin/Fe3+-siderophores transport system ATPase subunit
LTEEAAHLDGSIEVTQGRILVDGSSVQYLSQKSLRENIGVVEEEVECVASYYKSKDCPILIKNDSNFDGS